MRLRPIAAALTLLVAACTAAEDDPDAEPTDPPVVVEDDPAFAAERAELGWQPVMLASELASDTVGEPTDDELGDAIAGPVPGTSRDRFGGLRGSGLPTTATGFFHLERPAGAERVWLVDPDGNPFFGLGLNTVLRTANVPDIEAYLRRDPDFGAVARAEWDRLSTGDDGGFGYGFNSVPGFADKNDLDPSQPNPITLLAPYGVMLPVSVPQASPYAMKSAGGKILGAEDSTATLGDPFNPGYRAYLAAQWAPKVRPADPLLMVYWLDNEIGLFDHPLHLDPGTRDMRTWIWAACPAGSSIDAPACAPHALGRMLRDRHGTIARLEAAWGRSYGSFDAVLAARPTPGSEDANRRCDGECEQDLQRFARVLYRQWVKVWTQLVRALDPNHLVASPRMMVASSSAYCFWGIPGCIATYTDGRRVRQGDDVAYSPFSLFRRNGPYGFDLIAVNIYSRADRKGFDAPWLSNGFHTMMEESGLPIFVSEFGVRARIDGWTNSGGAGAFVPRAAAAEQQRTRGDYYRHDVVQLAKFRGIVGVSYHRWADRYLPDEQMNMGVVHRDGSRWDRFDRKIRDTHVGIYTRLRDLTGW